VNRMNCILAETVSFSQTDFGHRHVSVTCASLWRVTFAMLVEILTFIKTSHSVSKFCVVLSYFGVVRCEVCLILSFVNVHSCLLGMWTCG